MLSEEFFEYIDRELTAFGIKAVTYFDRDYPDFFREMPDPPLTLFCRGDTALLKKLLLLPLSAREKTLLTAEGLPSILSGSLQTISL